MTEQEIEKLREKLGDGFEVTAGYNCAVITVKDIWDGVEFAISDYKGIIYKIDRFETSPMKKIWFSHGKFLFPEKCKPSTEAAYVEQLKAKAKELYGEIKDGDRFDLSMLGGYVEVSVGNSKKSFTYQKLDDKLYFGDIPIYQQGKWAKRLPKYIVTPIEIHSSEPDIVGDQVIFIQMKIIHGDISQKNREDLAYHLAKCLEDYLNKSQ